MQTTIDTTENDSYNKAIKEYNNSTIKRYLVLKNNVYFVSYFSREFTEKYGVIIK